MDRESVHSPRRQQIDRGAPIQGAYRTRFSVTATQWDRFVAALEAPLPSSDRFVKLKDRRDPFTDDE